MDKIKIGILGYGNLGKGVEKSVKYQSDMELVGIYSRRKLDHPLAKGIDALEKDQNLDVLIICGGSATDLPHLTPRYAKRYNVVDSFDHHQQIDAHYQRVDAVARSGKKLALISCGWDPGLFSMMRTLFTAVIPDARVFTFWGKGISQGHSDAIRRIKGVSDGRQYTVPLESAIEAVKAGKMRTAETEPTKMHRRECFVVADEGADQKYIEKEIREMKDYFAGYETTVHFISQEKLEKEHNGFPHGGYVIGNGNGIRGSFQLQMESNPVFTASILTCYARAIYQMAKEGETGCKTILDIPLKYVMDDGMRFM